MSAATRNLAKRLLAHSVVRSGWWNVCRGQWARRDAVVILTYHRVIEKWDAALEYSQPGMVVTVPTFERQLSFLARHFDILPLSELLDGPARPRRRPRCVITFDDGWRDNYELALPILRKFRLPATLYLATDFIETDRVFWHTELIHILLHGDLSHAPVDAAPRLYPPVVLEEVRRRTGAGRVRCAADLDRLIELVKASCDEPTILSLVQTLGRAAGLSSPLFPARRFFLDWAQVREMATNGFEIGSHGCSHRIMTRLPRQEASAELVQSKAVIEGHLGRPVLHFAFPNEDSNSALIELAARAGYRTACAGMTAGQAAPSSIRLLRRAGIHEGVGMAGPVHDDAVFSLGLLRVGKDTPEAYR